MLAAIGGEPSMNVFLLDNYDSFTYNLVQLLGRIGADVTRRAQRPGHRGRGRGSAADAIVISPGPSRPEKAGISVELVQRLGPSVPMLGVCLGASGHRRRLRRRGRSGSTGARQGVAGAPRRVASFEGLPSPFDAGRYHSLAVSRERLPAELEVTAWAGRRGDGHAPPGASGGGRPVPPRVDPDRARGGPGPQLPRARHVAGSAGVYTCIRKEAVAASPTSGRRCAPPDRRRARRWSPARPR